LKVVTIASGKGGTGKTTLSINLALALSDAGHRPCLLDADFGMSNIQALTGIDTGKNVSEFINRRSCINDILIRNYQGVDLIPGTQDPGGSGEISRSHLKRVVTGLFDLDPYDYLLIDASAGISFQVLSLCMASDGVVLVTAAEPAALSDAFNVIAALARHGFKGQAALLLNKAPTLDIAKKAFRKLQEAAARRFSINPVLLGIVPYDNRVKLAAFNQVPCLMMYPGTPAVRCITKTAERLVKIFENELGRTGLKAFIARWRSFAQGLDPCAFAGQETGNSDGQSVHITPWIGTPRVTSDPEDVALGPPPLSTEAFKVNIKEKTRQTIARGRLREPTPEELDNWDNEPVIAQVKKFR